MWACRQPPSFFGLSASSHSNSQRSLRPHRKEPRPRVPRLPPAHCPRGGKDFTVQEAAGPRARFPGKSRPFQPWEGLRGLSCSQHFFQKQARRFMCPRGRGKGWAQTSSCVVKRPPALTCRGPGPALPEPGCHLPFPAHRSRSPWKSQV